MCLAVPGKILQIEGEGPLNRIGDVDFGGIHREVNLSYVPEAKVGDWVLIHAGFALQTVDEEEAKKTLEEMERLAEVGGGLGPAELPDDTDDNDSRDGSES